MTHCKKTVLVVGIIMGLVMGAAAKTSHASRIDPGIEDRWIVQAILSEDAGDYNTSRALYRRLFDRTGNKEYLIREARDALASRQRIEASIATLTQWVTHHPTDHDRELYLVLAALYTETGDLKEADEIVDAYLTQGEVSAEALREFGALKAELGQYRDALRLLERAYTQSPDEETASSMAALYLLKLKKTDKAIEVLERHLHDHPDATVGFYFKLIELYARTKAYDKVLDLYKRLYRRDPQNYFLQKIIEISLFLKDTEGLIRFLEQTEGNETLLYSIYKEYGLFAKATELTRTMYLRTNDPKWLAERAILIYEAARKQQQVTPGVLSEMRRLFEKAIDQGVSDPMYLNYYGYTLIDHDIQINKGIGLVRRALGKDPGNPYYLDSLAWGLYKKGECRNAYKLILKVIQPGSRNEKEIQDHFKAIKACMSHR